MENQSNNKKIISQLKSEVMNVEKAINRLQWRFKNENVKVGESKIIINELDVKAVEFLIEWINNQKKETLKENILFAKMFVYCLSNELDFYKDVSFANRKLNDELKLPIEHRYNEFTKKLNNLELNKFLNSKGIITDHFEKMGLNCEQENKQQELIKEYQKEATKFIKGVWSIQSVYKSLNNTITETINKFKNIP